jgi:hypothetical protein
VPTHHHSTQFFTSSSSNTLKENTQAEEEIIKDHHKSISLAQAVAHFTQANEHAPNKSSPSSSTHSQSALHPLLKQQTQQQPAQSTQQQQQQPTLTQAPFATSAPPKIDHTTPNLTCDSPSTANTSFEGVKFKTRSVSMPLFSSCLE